MSVIANDSAEVGLPGAWTDTPDTTIAKKIEITENETDTLKTVLFENDLEEGAINRNARFLYNPAAESLHVKNFIGTASRSRGCVPELLKASADLDDENKLLNWGVQYFAPVGNTVKHKPEGVDSFTLLPFKASDGTATGQLLLDTNNQKMYYRVGTTLNGLAWKEVADLNSTVAQAGKAETADNLNSGAKVDGALIPNVNGRVASVGGNGLNLSTNNANQIFFNGTNTSTAIYFGFEKGSDNRPIPEKYIFGKGTQEGGGAYNGSAELRAKKFTQDGVSVTTIKNTDYAKIFKHKSGDTKYVKINCTWYIQGALLIETYSNYKLNSFIASGYNFSNSMGWLYPKIRGQNFDSNGFTVKMGYNTQNNVYIAFPIFPYGGVKITGVPGSDGEIDSNTEIIDYLTPSIITKEEFDSLTNVQATKTFSANTTRTQTLQTYNQGITREV